MLMFHVLFEFGDDLIHRQVHGVDVNEPDRGAMENGMATTQGVMTHRPCIGVGFGASRIAVGIDLEQMALLTGSSSTD
jgi:hypothetical protein